MHLRIEISETESSHVSDYNETLKKESVQVQPEKNITST